MAIGHRIAVAVVLGLAFASWVVALAGISTITNDCYRHRTPSSNQNCQTTLSFQWWGVWFEFIVLVLIGVYAAMKTMALHQSTLQALLAIVTAINMLNAYQFLINGSSPDQVAYRQSGLNCAAAGYIMFDTFNCFLIFLLGSGFVWFGETDHFIGSGGGGAGAAGAPTYGTKGASAAARPPGPNFAAPATFASPLSGGGARAYLPNSPGGEPTVSAVRE